MLQGNEFKDGRPCEISLKLTDIEIVKAFDIAVPNAEQPLHHILGTACLSDQQKFLGWGNEVGDEVGDRPVLRQPVRPSNDPVSHFLPRIDDLMHRFVLGKLLDAQSDICLIEGGKVVGWSYLIGTCIEEEILRRLWHVESQFSDKLLLVSQLESVVFLYLRPQGTVIASPNGLATGRTTPVSWINPQIIAQAPQFLHGIVEQPCQVFLGDVGADSEIRPSHVSQEDGVPCEESHTHILLVLEQEARALQGMARCVDHRNTALPQPQLLMVLDLPDLKPVHRPESLRPHDHRHLELVVPGDVVGVVVGEHDVLEGGVPLGDEVQVGTHVEDGVDEDAFLVRLDVVGEDGQLCGLELGNIVPCTVLLSHQRVLSVH